MPIHPDALQFLGRLRPRTARHELGQGLSTLEETRVNALMAEPRFQAIPGGLEIDGDLTYGPGGAFHEWHNCGCITTEEGAVSDRCLQHYRDALWYRRRIKQARHATAAGLEWPTPPYVPREERTAPQGHAQPVSK